jgi:hypothetical protein
MMQRIIIVLLCALFTGCRQPLPTLEDDALYEFTEVAGDDYCNDSANHSKCRGQLFLKKNGKVLLQRNCNTQDSAVYYRGTYFVSDSGLSCSFTARYVVAPECADCPAKPSSMNAGNNGGFKDMKVMRLDLLKLSCATNAYVNGAERITSFTRVYRKSGHRQMETFCNFISRYKAFPDFYCSAVNVPGSQSAQADPDISPLEQIIAHYRARYVNFDYSATKSDSTFTLHFSRSGKTDEDEESSFSVIIYSNQHEFTGDLDNDGSNEKLVTVFVNDEISTPWREYFLFSGKKGAQLLRTVASSFELARCRAGSYSGMFEAREISNGKISGVSICYTNQDAECCPSVHVDSKVYFEGGQLIPEQ